MILENNDLVLVKGGLLGKTIGYGIWFVIGGVVAFISGVIDGYMNPIKCNK